MNGGEFADQIPKLLRLFIHHIRFAVPEVPLPDDHPKHGVEGEPSEFRAQIHPSFEPGSASMESSVNINIESTISQKICPHTLYLSSISSRKAEQNSTAHSFRRLKLIMRAFMADRVSSLLRLNFLDAAAANLSADGVDTNWVSLNSRVG
ncbi:unnamed protein product [Linum trigynum]|uniref:Uncharacterized protein n=1 Tax=Linum trigynum TaxID=586398 RepID=A0AAV2CJI5_9ROSI